MGGFLSDLSMDEVTRKEMIRSSRRRPLEETITDVGEGRGTEFDTFPYCPPLWGLTEPIGVYPPGYEDRRRARLAEKYSVDFTNVERR